MTNISLFKNFTKGIGSQTLPQIVEGIRGDRYKDAILKIRELVEKGDTEKVSRLKKGLEAFTVSGLFEGGRKMSFLEIYNPFIILDIDKLDPKDLLDLIEQVKMIKFTRVAFISPSGRGLKIIVEVDSEMKKHSVAYWQVMNFYKDTLMVEVDKSGKDITRLCFMSYDPEAYYNEESAVFNVLKIDRNNGHACSSQKDLLPGRAPDHSDEEANLSVDYKQAFTICVTQTNARLEFKKGNRNNYIYQLAVTCRHAGIPLEVAVNESKKAFDLNNTEIERTIRSAYNWQPWSSPQNVSDSSTNPTIELPDEVSPIIPASVYDHLPSILKRGCAPLVCERERDVFLTGALGVLSGMLPNVTGNYGGSDYSANLYAFVIAPAASGKSTLKCAEILGSKYEDELEEQNEHRKANYEEAVKKYLSDQKKVKDGELKELPEKPKEEAIKTFFIPANSSSAMLIEHLKNNGGSGVLFETEADTLSNVLKQDWGDYSEILRKAFHHDTISSSRKSTKGSVKIKNAALSVVLSGTLGQVTDLIPNAENGLFSRFIYYIFKADNDWRDQAPRNNKKRSDRFYKQLSIEASEMVHFLETHHTEFTLEEKHWDEVIIQFKKISNETIQDFGDEANSIVKRLGLISFRIAMILSTLRKFDKRSKQEKLFCNDLDFAAAMTLTKIYWKHSFFVYDRLPNNKRNKVQIKNIRKQKFYNALPKKFKRNQAIVISEKLRMKRRTADRYLKQLVEKNFLIQSGDDTYGVYTKL